MSAAAARCPSGSSVLPLRGPRTVRTGRLGSPGTPSAGTQGHPLELPLGTSQGAVTDVPEAAGQLLARHNMRARVWGRCADQLSGACFGEMPQKQRQNHQQKQGLLQSSFSKRQPGTQLPYSHSSGRVNAGRFLLAVGALSFELGAASTSEGLKPLEGCSSAQPGEAAGCSVLRPTAAGTRPLAYRPGTPAAPRPPQSPRWAVIYIVQLVVIYMVQIEVPWA